VAGFWAIVDHGADAGAVAAAMPMLARAGIHDPVALHAPRVLLGSLDFPDGVSPDASLDTSPPALVGALHGRLGVIDHPAFHASERERARWVASLCAAGVPVSCAEPSAELRELLGPELAGLVGSARPRDLADLDARERLSVAMRRAALRDHVERAAPPPVSVVFATRREEWLEHGLAQVERQSYEPRELVCCLHGPEFSADVESRIRAAVSGEVKVVRVDGELTLGDALNAGVAASEGELVTKMDDDDYYNVDHLWDLALACEYSGADLVGKGAEFVYLGGSVDLTIRRFMGDGESDHPRLAGGALIARRGPLEAVGGWPIRNRGEDTWIVKNFQSAGSPTYRCHGFGYILNRHFRGHTWNTFVDYFLVQSQREWRGLRLDEAGIEP